MQGRRLGIRWTVGDADARGYEALRLSIWGAYRLFGSRAAYAVCVHSVPLSVARARLGPVPPVHWVSARHDLPACVGAYVDSRWVDGSMWRFGPLPMFRDRHELALDHGCILWELPESVRAWLDDERDDSVLVAEDVRARFGKFAPLCGMTPRKLGIRGLGPGFDLDAALTAVLRDYPTTLSSDLDAQGLQLSALTRAKRVHVVSLEDVTVCSPFAPYLPHLGRAGAHFSALSSQQPEWKLKGRPAAEHVRDHWDSHRAELHARVGIEPRQLAPRQDDSERASERRIA